MACVGTLSGFSPLLAPTPVSLGGPHPRPGRSRRDPARGSRRSPSRGSPSRVPSRVRAADSPWEHSARRLGGTPDPRSRPSCAHSPLGHPGVEAVIWVDRCRLAWAGWIDSIGLGFRGVGAGVIGRTTLSGGPTLTQVPLVGSQALLASLAVGLVCVGVGVRIYSSRSGPHPGEMLVKIPILAFRAFPYGQCHPEPEMARPMTVKRRRWIFDPVYGRFRPISRVADGPTVRMVILMTRNCGNCSAHFATELRPWRASADDGRIGANSFPDFHGRIPDHFSGFPRSSFRPFPRFGWRIRLGSADPGEMLAKFPFGPFAAGSGEWVLTRSVGAVFGSSARRAVIVLYGPILTHGVRQDRRFQH